MLYVKPMLEITKFEQSDVICSSIGGNTNYNGNDGNDSNVSGNWNPQ